MSWNSARGLFIIAEAWAATVFVLCSAFVINSITKASAPCHVVRSQTASQGPFTAAFEAERKGRGKWKQFILAHHVWAETLQLMGGSICFSSIGVSSRGWAFFLTSLLQWVNESLRFLFSLALFTYSFTVRELLHSSFGEGEKGLSLVKGKTERWES